MNRKIICTAVLLVAVIMASQSVLTGCKINSNNNSSPAQTSSELSEINTDILAQADNMGTIDNSSECTYAEFKSFNIPKNVYDNIATSIYISEVKNSIGLPLLRKTGEVYYSVHPIKTDSNKQLYGFIMYNEQGKLIDGWCANRLLNKGDFKELSIGNNMNKVSEIDPYCCFMENLNKNQATSYHKLSRGKIYVVDYQRNNKESEYIVKNMYYNNDPCNFTNCIYQKDLELIL
ncbi:MAG: hypothetical protein UD936_01005 [Acutalibacteraceae bacterium]|nr:hypothetical protein [Acutalibacteraceae bacterium]